MVNGPSGIDRRFSSRSELNRLLLALAFAAVVFSTVAHIASLVGVTVIKGRIWQRGLGWVLGASLMWVLVRSRRSTTTSISRWWSAAIGITWLNAFVYILFLPIGPQQAISWPAMTRWLGLDTTDLFLFYARESSAVHLALALSLFVGLWVQSTARDGPA
jgi:hypothetical protein